MAAPINALHYGPMDLSCHNPQVVAGLIYESAPELFALTLGTNAIAHLTQLVQRSHNRFSHHYIRIATLDQQPVGVAVLVPAAQVQDDGDSGEVLPRGRQVWFTLVQWLLRRWLLRHDYPPGSYYMGNLAVAAEYRNRGIGRQLLHHCMAEVAPNPIFISVDVGNARAQNLYQSMGFQRVETRSLGGWGWAIGSHVLCWSPEVAQPFNTPA